jgi:hypothetical protein
VFHFTPTSASRIKAINGYFSQPADLAGRPCAVCFFKQRILQFAKAGFIEEPEAEDDALPEQADDEPNLSSQRLQALMTALLNHLKGRTSTSHG